jgi:hypothetical protein
MDRKGECVNITAECHMADFGSDKRIILKWVFEKCKK